MDGFTDALLDGCEFSRSSLYMWPFEPVARAGKPPNAQNNQRPQYYHRCIIEGQRCEWVDSRQHKQDRDEHNPNDGDHANGPAPGSQVPGSVIKVSGEEAQQDWQYICDVETDDGN